MTDKELRNLARTKPDELIQMISSETDRQDDIPMTKEELWDSQKWVSRARAALKEQGHALMESD